MKNMKLKKFKELVEKRLSKEEISELEHQAENKAKILRIEQCAGVRNVIMKHGVKN